MLSKFLSFEYNLFCEFLVIKLQTKKLNDGLLQLSKLLETTSAVEGECFMQNKISIVCGGWKSSFNWILKKIYFSPDAAAATTGIGYRIIPHPVLAVSLEKMKNDAWELRVMKRFVKNRGDKVARIVIWSIEAYFLQSNYRF